MDKSKAIEILKDFNDYRRNKGAYDVDRPCAPKFLASEISEAIDVAIGVLVGSDKSDMTVMDAVIAETGIGYDDIVSSRRDRNVVVARCIVAKMMRVDGFTLQEIGKVIKRTHAAVMHLLDVIDEWFASPEQYRRELRLMDKVKKRVGYKQEKRETQG